jgi:hypothetical protein
MCNVLLISKNKNYQAIVTALLFISSGWWIIILIFYLFFVILYTFNNFHNKISTFLGAVVGFELKGLHFLGKSLAT